MKLSAQDRDEILAMKGIKTAKELAEQYKVSVKTIERVFQSEGDEAWEQGGLFQELADAAAEEEAPATPPPEARLPKPRALIRFKTGSAVWAQNMYKVQQDRRRDPNALILYTGRDVKNGGAHTDTMVPYLLWQELNWHDKKDQYNARRRALREKALVDLSNNGFYIKNGRPALPPGAAAIPKAAIEPVSLDELVVLGDPRAFEKVDYAIKVPEDYSRVAAYLGVTVINVDVSPLKWGMWRFAAWDELKPKTRTGYIGNARNALGGHVGYLQDEANADKVEQYLRYDAAKDKYYIDLEKDLVGADEDEGDEVVEVKEAPPPKRTKAGAVKPPKPLPFSRNPIRVVEFMLSIKDFNPWFVVQQTCDVSYTIANSRASALASCCYAFLRYLYKNKQYNTERFRRVLLWSHVFERYTRVAKRITGDKHASQQTTPEKLANTAEWGAWKAKAREFLQRHLKIDGNKVTIRTRADGWKPWWAGHPTEMRGRVIVADNVKDAVVIKPKQLLPWWKEEFVESEKGRDRPNLRELRDCAMVACYSLLAPIRLDWATVVIMTDAEFAKFQADKATEDAEKVREETEQIAGKEEPVKKKRGKKFNVNILVVDNKANPTKADMAYFGQMKNIASFKVKPVPKYVRQESPLCEAILLMFLQERNRLGFVSECLFPYSTYTSQELDNECFNNSAFGERLADVAWDLIRLNFTETLMRRSYITWFWKQPGNDPLDTTVWDRLLPSVHQNSKDANLGYIKGSLKEWQECLAANPNATAHEKSNKRHELNMKALEENGHNVEKGQDPEVDKDDAKEYGRLRVEIAAAKKEEAFKVKELRRSKRLAGAPDAPPYEPKDDPAAEAAEAAKDAAFAAQKAQKEAEEAKKKAEEAAAPKAAPAPRAPKKPRAKKAPAAEVTAPPPPPPPPPPPKKKPAPAPTPAAAAKETRSGRQTRARRFGDY